MLLTYSVYCSYHLVSLFQVLSYLGILSSIFISTVNHTIYSLSKQIISQLARFVRHLALTCARNSNIFFSLLGTILKFSNSMTHSLIPVLTTWAKILLSESQLIWRPSVLFTSFFPFFMCSFYFSLLSSLPSFIPSLSPSFLESNLSFIPSSFLSFIHSKVPHSFTLSKPVFHLSLILSNSSFPSSSPGPLLRRCGAWCRRRPWSARPHPVPEDCCVCSEGPARPRSGAPPSLSTQRLMSHECLV